MLSSTPSSIDGLSHQYIALAFALEQHEPGLVDAYIGPPDLRTTAEAQPPRPPAALAEEISALRTEVGNSTYPYQRKGYMTAQLTALHAIARRLAGDPLPYRDEVRACFDIEPQHVPEAVFAQAAAELDTLLPGSGSVAERLHAWQQHYEVAPAVAQEMIARVADEARARTARLVSLPPGDHVTFELVTDKPWSGYNWFLGAGRSRIDINTDLPIRAHSLLDLVCHEAYPGHHTEHALKAQVLYEGRGWGEHAIQLINTPECVIAEGIATLAAEVIFGDEAATWAAAHLYPLAGLVSDPQQETRIGAARRALRAVAPNAALLLHAEQASPDEVIAYLMRYSLCSEQEAHQRLRFLSTPLWRPYIFTYTAGHDLLGRWLGRGETAARFRILLTEQVYPSQIAAHLLAGPTCTRD